MQNPVQPAASSLPTVGAVSSSLDTTRVYTAGHSDGALMVERLALEANDTIAAAGVIAGNLSVSNDNGGSYRCQGYTSPWTVGGGDAVPMFLFKGDADMRIPYGAQSGPDALGRLNIQFCQAIAIVQRGSRNRGSG